MSFGDLGVKNETQCVGNNYDSTGMKRYLLSVRAFCEFNTNMNTMSYETSLVIEGGGAGLFLLSLLS